MKKILLAIICAVIAFYVQQVSAQDNIDVIYKKDAESFEKDKPIGIRVKRNYSVRLLNTHNGIFDTKVIIGDFIQSSNVPEVLKFLSISSTDDLRLSQVIFGVGSSSEADIKEVIEKLGQPIIDGFKEFLQNTKTLDESILACWKDQTCKYDDDKKKAENIRDTSLGAEATKDGAVRVVGQKIHQVNLVKAAVDAYLKSHSVSRDFLAFYANFLAGLDLIISDSTKYSNAINLIYDVINNSEKLEDIKQVATAKKYANFWSNKKFVSEGDLTKIKIILINKLDRDTVLMQSLAYFTYGQWKFDFSTGFYWNNIVNDSYSMVAYNSDSSKVTLKKDYSKKYDVAIGGQLHASYKIDRSIAIGGNLGAAISPFDGGLRYLTGFHLMFGQYKQIIISGGWSFAKVKRLSEAIPVTATNVGNEIEVPVANKDPKLVDKYDHGVFFGISYNLSSIFKPLKK